ncbi:MAG: hypothetical protein JWL72_1016 [Ilumatobacteraceae bacterium]|nr:hypothetical protein [Ilumatobacteraceae bacterium]
MSPATPVGKPVTGSSVVVGATAMVAGAGAVVELAVDSETSDAAVVSTAEVSVTDGCEGSEAGTTEFACAELPADPWKPSVPHPAAAQATPSARAKSTMREVRRCCCVRVMSASSPEPPTVRRLAAEKAR